MEDFSLKDESFNAKVIEVIDGDTVRVVFYRRGEKIQRQVKLSGYNKLGLNPQTDITDQGDDVENATKAKVMLEELIGGKMVTIDCEGENMLGLLMATVHIKNEEPNINVSTWMVKNGQGIAVETAPEGESSSNGDISNGDISGVQQVTSGATPEVQKGKELIPAPVNGEMI